MPNPPVVRRIHMRSPRMAIHRIVKVIVTPRIEAARPLGSTASQGGMSAMMDEFAVSAFNAE